MTWKRSVLVVANVTAASDELLEALHSRAPAELTLIVPATGGRSADREAAGRSLEKALGRMRAAGLEVSGTVADPDPVVAVHEAWDPARFDEVVVSTLPTGASRWLQIDLPRRIEKITDAPVTHVVSTPPSEQPPPSPPPKKRDSLGVLSPLETLGWGRRARSEGPETPPD
jgi:hypothetical protein